MSDLLERLRDMAAGKHDDLGVAAEAIEEIIDLNGRVVQLEEERDKLRAEIAELRGRCSLASARVDALWRTNEELRAQIAAHEKVCAGVLVPVRERKPERRGMYWCEYRYPGDSESSFGELYYDLFSWPRSEFERTVIRWLDARMPGGEG